MHCSVLVQRFICGRSPRAIHSRPELLCCCRTRTASGTLPESHLTTQIKRSKVGARLGRPDCIDESCEKSSMALKGSSRGLNWLICVEETQCILCLAKDARQRLDATASAVGRDINGQVVSCKLCGGLSLKYCGKGWWNRRNHIADCQGCLSRTFYYVVSVVTS